MIAGQADERIVTYIKLPFKQDKNTKPNAMVHGIESDKKIAS
jgi:hypothetical protein